MIKISFLILCLQTINSAICWDTNSPLILNLNKDGVFFPNYVNSIQNPETSWHEIIYKPQDDKTAATYTFCRQFPAPIEGFVGQLLSIDKNRTCRMEVDSFSHMYIREQKKYSPKKPIPCQAGAKESEVTGFQYKVYFNVQIEGKTYVQNSYNYCYDQENWKTLYAYYDLENPSLLKNEILIGEQYYEFKLKRPNLDGPADIDIVEYYEKQKDYVPYEVAIPEFIPFAHWKISFHQWNNFAPMYTFLQDFWATSIKNIRSKLAKKTEPVKIISGIHGVARTQGVTMLLSRGKITIPMVWWVVIQNKDKSQGTGFIMHNYTAEGGFTKPKLWCEESKCNDAGLKDIVPQDDEYKENDVMMYCCSAADVAKKVRLSEDVISPTENLLVF